MLCVGMRDSDALRPLINQIKIKNAEHSGIACHRRAVARGFYFACQRKASARRICTFQNPTRADALRRHACPDALRPLINQIQIKNAEHSGIACHRRAVARGFYFACHRKASARGIWVLGMFGARINPRPAAYSAGGDSARGKPTVRWNPQST